MINKYQKIIRDAKLLLDPYRDAFLVETASEHYIEVGLHRIDKVVELTPYDKLFEIASRGHVDTLSIFFSDIDSDPIKIFKNEHATNSLYIGFQHTLDNRSSLYSYFEDLNLIIKRIEQVNKYGTDWYIKN